MKIIQAGSTKCTNMKTPTVFCAFEPLQSHKAVRGFLYCGQNKHIKALSDHEVEKSLCPGPVCSTVLLQNESIP